ncbi:hypothetical protein [Bordetella petrii]|uniref:hypothetical protein n=1 Tax=Bordetella petrii TaxID=94624 RepID=UPI001E296857|nr:hypothetical protein [Bordetella petrii]
MNAMNHPAMFATNGRMHNHSTHITTANQCVVVAPTPTKTNQRASIIKSFMAASLVLSKVKNDVGSVLCFAATTSA